MKPIFAIKVPFGGSSSALLSSPTQDSDDEGESRMYKSRHSPTGSKNGTDYEFVAANGNTTEGPPTWQTKLAAHLRNFVRLPWWNFLLPVIATLLSAALLVTSIILSIRWVRGSGLLIPAYKEIPLISQAQIEAATKRHITMDQCLTTYPGLFEYVLSRHTFGLLR